MWYWGNQEAHGLSTFLATSVSKYEALHPNIKINTVLQSTDNLMPNFAAAAKAKKGPDIEYRWGGIWALQDAWDGNLAPISDYIPAAERAHYLNSSEDTWDGKLWSAPWYVQPSFPILYRKDVLAQAGIASAPDHLEPAPVGLLDAAVEGHHPDRRRRQGRLVRRVALLDPRLGVADLGRRAEAGRRRHEEVHRPRPGRVVDAARGR